MTNEELADLITTRTSKLQDHFDMKLTALQAHIYGKLLSMESDMLGTCAGILRLGDAVNAHAKALDKRR